MTYLILRVTGLTKIDGYKTNLNLLLDRYYRRGTFDPSEVIEPTLGCVFRDIQSYNKCRLSNKIYFRWFTTSVDHHDLYNISVDTVSYLSILPNNKCIHPVSALFHTNPTCFKFGCKDFIPFELKGSYFKQTYMCFPYEYLFEGLFDRYTIDIDIPSLDFNISMAKSVDKDNAIKYHTAKQVTVSLSPDSPTRYYIYCDISHACFALTPYCESYISRSGALPLAYSIDVMSDHLLLRTSNMSNECKVTDRFPLKDAIKWIPVYFDIKFELPRDDEGFNALLPHDMLSVRTYEHNMRLTFDQMGDCNFTKYIVSPNRCGYTTPYDNINYTIHYHVPSAYNFKISSIVSDFFDKLYYELEQLTEFIFNLIVINFLKQLYKLIEYVFSFLPGGIFSLFDIVIVYSVMTYWLGNNLLTFILSIILVFCRRFY